MTSGPLAGHDELPLAGVKIVEFGVFIAGPGLSMALGDLGADIIKVESLEGDPVRHVGVTGEAMLRYYNRGKRSIAIDLRTDEGREIALSLIKDADVVVENRRPGGMERLGLGHEVALALNPRCVYVSVKGFSVGTGASRTGLDVLAQAESGMMYLSGDEGDAPQRIGFTLIDNSSTHAAAEATLAALFRRERTGRGGHVEISLMEMALHLMAPVWEEYFLTGSPPPRNARGAPMVAPSAELLATADGAIVLSAYTNAHWHRLLAVLDLTELADDARFATIVSRVAHRAALRTALEAALAPYTSAEAMALLSTAGIVVGEVRTLPEALAHPDIESLGMFRPVSQGDGTRMSLRLPFRIDGAVFQDTRPAPGHGADAATVLDDLGYSPDERRRLADRGIVGSTVLVG